MRNFLSVIFALAFSVSSAFAGGTLTTMGIGSAGASLPPITSTYVGGLTCAVAASCTYSNAPIGTASASRIVVVGITNTANRPLTSLTIGGISATAVIAPSASVGLYQANVPTGTTANIVYSYSGGTALASIVAWTFDNYQSATAISSNSNVTLSATVPLSSSSQPGGLVIAFSAAALAGGLTGSMTGEINATDYNAITTSTGRVMGGHNQTAGGTSATTINLSATPTQQTAVQAVWR